MSPTPRTSPGAAAADYHLRRCAQCRAVAIAGQPMSKLCRYGQILATAAILARATRRAS